MPSCNNFQVLSAYEKESRNKKGKTKLTEFFDTLGIRKLSKSFVEKLDLREDEEVFPDVIRKLGFKNS
jgi:hypothetical protein